MTLINGIPWGHHNIQPFRMRDAPLQLFIKQTLIPVNDIFVYNYREIRSMPRRPVVQPLIHYWIHSWIEPMKPQKIMSSFELNGIRNIGFDMYKRDIRELKSRWKNYVKTILPCPDNLNGRGIVMCAGGLRYFTCAWVNIMTLRKLAVPCLLNYVYRQ